MAIGDITPYNDGAFGQAGSVIQQVALQATPPLINAGEPVGKTIGTNTQYVINAATSGPTQITGGTTLSGTNLSWLGISASASTETSTADGTVAVIPFTPGQIWLANPKVAATWNTQAKYNALVGARVTMDLTTGVYTINSSDAAGNGLVVENLNITQYPGKVAFSVRTLSTFYGAEV